MNDHHPPAYGLWMLVLITVTLAIVQEGALVDLVEG